MPCRLLSYVGILILEQRDEDEQMGDVDNPEDKSKSETFGENDEKLVRLSFLRLARISHYSGFQ